MIALALLALMAPELAYNSAEPVLFRVPDFTFGSDFESFEYNTGHPVQRKLSKDGKCSVSFAPNTTDLHLYVVSGMDDPANRRAVNALAFMVDGRDLVVYRLGFAYPPPSPPSDVEYKVVPTKRGKMLVAEFDGGFMANEGELKLELGQDGKLLYAYAKEKIAGAHLVPFFMRDTHVAECRFE